VGDDEGRQAANRDRRARAALVGNHPRTYSIPTRENKKKVKMQKPVI
jgi:hypothetical protein